MIIIKEYGYDHPQFDLLDKELTRFGFKSDQRGVFFKTLFEFDPSYPYTSEIQYEIYIEPSLVRIFFRIEDVEGKSKATRVWTDWHVEQFSVLMNNLRKKYASTKLNVSKFGYYGLHHFEIDLSKKPLASIVAEQIKLYRAVKSDVDKLARKFQSRKGRRI